jgi:hypothetical protein
MGLYSSNCRRFFVCRAVNWELHGQFTSYFAQLLELLVLWSVYFLVRFRFFIPELWDFIHQIVGDFVLSMLWLTFIFVMIVCGLLVANLKEISNVLHQISTDSAWKRNQRLVFVKWNKQLWLPTRDIL